MIIKKFQGKTEAEAWYEFCQVHSYVCFDDVIGIYPSSDVYDGFCISRDFEGF